MRTRRACWALRCTGQGAALAARACRGPARAWRRGWTAGAGLRPGPHARARGPTLLSVQSLRTTYRRRDGDLLHAVDDVSFDIARGETLGLVGESGCGKSTLSRTLLRLTDPASGRIVLDGVDLASLRPRQARPWRRRIQMVFQDPYASLNRRSVYDTLDAALALHGERDRHARRARIAAMLDRVGLPARRRPLPHEFSGGQRQRIGIARALILRPDLVVLDEPVSALDVSIQAQILNLLVDLKQDFGLSYLFISHDLSVVRYLSDRVIVMHQGRIVEEGLPGEICARRAIPYPGADRRRAQAGLAARRNRRARARRPRDARILGGPAVRRLRPFSRSNQVIVRGGCVAPVPVQLQGG